MVKRILDFTLSLISLILLSPVFLVISVFIKSVSPGPVLFTQERIGQFGRPFQIYKFRTMKACTQKDGANNVTLRDDPRLIAGSSFLRKYKIDELPQLVNVLKGTMSLVGPRPTVREDMERMTEGEKKRFLARPGLTGLAQIRGNTSLPWPRRIKHDLEYINRQGLGFDLRIIAETAWAILVGDADTHPLGGSEWGD
jgi:lipopolysaccharide/colanic/teichoic acid biosynthesis glycosyltransferase